MNILLTGATGFVGNAIAWQLATKTEDNIVAAVRGISSALPGNIKQLVLGSLQENVNYTTALKSVEVVVHAAARVHVMQDDACDSLVEFRKVNVEGTLNLARQAAEVGVKRFVFISSIKVNGESTELDKPFLENDQYIPIDPYGLSKWEAEQGLFEISQETGMEVVVIRPPLIYGIGVKANFQKMMQWMNKGIPLPFGAIDNQRSLVALDNLVDFIVLCTHHPKAAGEVFLISDGADVSTTELLRKVARAMDKKACLIAVPVGLMRFFARLLGKADVADRLFGSLQVDSSKARELLGWKPVITMDEQLRKMTEPMR